MDGQVDPEEAAPPVMRVVHADTGEPAPDAEVRFLAGRWWFADPWEDVREVLSTGTKLEVDADGRFSLPRPKERRWVMLADRWGAMKCANGVPEQPLLRLHECVRFRASI